jgi:hypothetical protein
LSDQGFKVSNLKGDAYADFIKIFGPRIAKFTADEVEQLRKISRKLMLN